MSNFRIDAQNFFLTYPKCDLTKEEALELILEAHADKLKYAVIAFERHADGSPHLHIQLAYHKKTCIRKDSYFNLGEYHGNYQATRSIRKVAQYCTKEEDYLLWGITSEEFLSLCGRRNIYAEALHSKSYDEACEIIKGGQPRDWVLHGDKVRQNLKRDFDCAFKDYSPIFDQIPFNVPQELQDWVDDWKGSRTPCLVLIGPTQCGKTAWARSLVQPHVYWKGMTNLDSWNPNAKLLIFDDFDWKYLPSPKNFLTQSGDCTVTDKYRKKHDICVNMPAILVCNEMPTNDRGLSLSLDDYWSKNMKFVQINSKLYV